MVIANISMMQRFVHAYTTTPYAVHTRAETNIRVFARLSWYWNTKKVLGYTIIDFSALIVAYFTIKFQI